jgi:hypothetical protein
MVRKIIREELSARRFHRADSHPGAPVVREYARYERRVVQAPPERVVGAVARQYKVGRLDASKFLFLEGDGRSKKLQHEV